MVIYLETDRLVLRRFTAGDVDAIVELDSDPAVMRFINGGRPTPRAEVEDEILPFWLAYHDHDLGYGFWAAIEKSTGQFLGWFHFRPHHGRMTNAGPGGVELGYRLRRSGLGQGVRDGGVPRADPQGLHRPGRRAGLRRDDGRQHRAPAG